MEWRIYGIEGPFGSGKSAYAVRIVKDIVRFRKGVEIWTNIKLSDKINAKVHFCEPLDLWDIFTQILPEALEERERLTKPRNDGLLDYNRKAFKKRIIVIDEAGVVLNNRKFGEFDNDITAFINQVRKYNTDIILVSADGSQVEKNLRRYVKQWYSLEPIPFVGWLFPFDLLRRVYWHIKDEEGRILLKEKMKSDGTIIRVPQRFFKWIVNISKSWSFYDDLALNVGPKLLEKVKVYNEKKGG